MTLNYDFFFYQQKKWQDFVAPPDPRLLEQQRLEREKIEAWKKKNQEKK